MKIYKRGFTLIELLVVLAIIGIVVLVLFRATSTYACGFLVPCEPDVDARNTFTKEAAVTEVNQRNLLKNSPIPTFENSQERENLIKRLNTFNKADKISYVYLVSYGKVMAFYTAKGKISSVSSYLTNPSQLINRYGDQCNGTATDCFVVDSPDLDGSYGTNGDAIFFFTTDGTYVEWKGEYMVADQPLKLSTQPELVRTIK